MTNNPVVAKPPALFVSKPSPLGDRGGASHSPSSTSSTSGSPSIMTVRQFTFPDDPDELERECRVFLRVLQTIFADSKESLPPGLLVAPEREGLDKGNATKRLVESLRCGVLFARMADRIYPQSIPAYLLRSPDDTSGTTGGGGGNGGMPSDLFLVATRLDALLKIFSCPPFRILPITHRVNVKHVMDGSPAVVLDLFWRLLCELLLANMRVDKRPQLVWLREPEENLSTLLRLPEEQILLRWVNLHLQRAGSVRCVRNLGQDFSDSSVFAILMDHLAGDRCCQESLRNIFGVRIAEAPDEDHGQVFEAKTWRAEFLLVNQKRLGCDYEIPAEEIASGNSRMILLLLAFLFENFLGIREFAEEEEVLWLEKEMLALNQELQQTKSQLHSFRQKTAQVITEAKQLAIEEQQELRNQAKARELQLYQQMEDLHLSVHESEEAHQQRFHHLAGHFGEYRHAMSSQLSRSIAYLNAYMERRREIFQDANLYTISAFNKEGKRITFEIPAPSLTSKCTFDFVEELPPVSPRPPREYEPTPPPTPGRRKRPPPPPPPTFAKQQPVFLLPLDSPPATPSPGTLSNHALTPLVESNGSPPVSPTTGAAPSFQSSSQDEQEGIARSNSIASLHVRRYSAPPDFLLETHYLSAGDIETLLSGGPDLPAVPLETSNRLLTESFSNSRTHMISREKIRASLRVEKRPVSVVGWEPPLPPRASDASKLSNLGRMDAKITLRMSMTTTTTTTIVEKQVTTAHEMQEIDEVEVDHDEDFQESSAAPFNSPINLEQLQHEQQLPQHVHELIQWLVQENMQQTQQIQLLAAKIDEMSWLNQVMGDKVKAFSEELINGHGNRKTSSSSRNTGLGKNSTFRIKRK